MARETRATQRLVITPSMGLNASTGIIAARRFNVPAAPTISTLSLPNKVRGFIAKNSGLFPIRFNFNSDGTSDYWELGVGEALPFPIPIAPDTSINAAAIDGASTAECIFWG